MQRPPFYGQYKGKTMEWSAMHTAQVLVLGCGNILKGDDGVGPAVAHYLEQHEALPGNVVALDLGTSIKHLLFDIVTMQPESLRMIIIVDATTRPDRAPGEFWEIDVEQMHPEKVKDFSIHMFPSVNLLRKIMDETRIALRIIAVQTQYIPEELDEVLSEPVRAAVPRVAQHVLEICAEVGD